MMTGKAGRKWFFAVALVTLGMVRAQQKSDLQDLIYLDNYDWGDLYLKAGSQNIRLTTYGLNSHPVVSPDGQWVAYLSEPQWSNKFFRNATQTGYGDFWLNAHTLRAQNIWIMNLRTRQAKRIAGQPQEKRTPDSIVRSAVSWSDDSQQLAWTEARMGDFNDARIPDNTSWKAMKLNTYQLGSGKTESLKLSFPMMSYSLGLTTPYFRPSGGWFAIGRHHRLPLSSDWGDNVIFTISKTGQVNDYKESRHQGAMDAEWVWKDKKAEVVQLTSSDFESTKTFYFDLKSKIFIYPNK